MARRLRRRLRAASIGRAPMWKQTVRKLVVLPPRRRSAPLWWAGGLFLLLLPVGFMALGDGSRTTTRGARLAMIVLGSGLLLSMGSALRARRRRDS